MSSQCVHLFEEKKTSFASRKRLEEMRTLVKKSLSLVDVVPRNIMGVDDSGSSIEFIFRDRVREAEMEDYADFHNHFDSKYEVGKIIGEGGSGLVKKIVNRVTGEIFVAKVIKSNDYEILKAVKQEFEMLHSLSHPAIAKVYELYYDPRSSCVKMVQQYIKGKSLDQYLQKNGPLPEGQAKIVLKQLAEAVKYLHENGICHRDIKTENIIVESNSNNQLIVHLIDFNVAKYFRIENELRKMLTQTGTPQFSAPEIFSGHEYTQSADLWSLGVVLYVILSGQLPFDSPSMPELIEQISQGSLFIEELGPWEFVTPRAKELIRRILVVNPDMRASVEEILSHPWLSQSTTHRRICKSFSLRLRKQPSGL